MGNVKLLVNRANCDYYDFRDDFLEVNNYPKRISGPHSLGTEKRKSADEPD